MHPKDLNRIRKYITKWNQIPKIKSEQVNLQMVSWKLYHSTQPIIPNPQNSSILHKATPMLHTNFKPKIHQLDAYFTLQQLYPKWWKVVTFPTVSAMRSIQGSGNGVPLSHVSSSFIGSWKNITRVRKLRLIFVILRKLNWIG